MSKRFSLDTLDIQSILRGLYVSGAGFLITIIPMFMGYSYEFKGHDYTIVVTFILSNLINFLRKWLADNSSVPLDQDSFTK